MDSYIYCFSQLLVVTPNVKQILEAACEVKVDRYLHCVLQLEAQMSQ